MDTSVERKHMLLAMRDDIMARLEDAQTDLDAVDRLIAVQKVIAPPVVLASVEEIREAVVVLLMENGEPVHRKTMLEQLEEYGIHVGGKVPVNSLSSTLSRFSKDFVPHGQGVWGLKSWQSANGQVAKGIIVD